MSDNIVLNVGGKRYDGWTSVQVEKSLFSLSGAFGIAGTDIFPGDFKKWEFSLGDPCKVEINGQTIINGYIEDIPITYDALGHNLQIGGRDKTADLIDCSFIEADQEWIGRSVFRIMDALCSPFGITVYVDDSVATEASQEPRDSFKAQMGMTIFEMFKPMLDDKAILPVSYADGKLTLTRAGTQKAHDRLELGKNIKSGSINQSIRDRFGTYLVLGQGVGNDDKDFGVYVGPEGVYTDEVITRYRPTIIIPDTKIEGPGECKKRAQWEESNRAGQSISVEYVVQGWTQSNGEVWPLNALVQVKDSFLGLNEEMLIAATSNTVDNDSGKITTLTLIDPKAFEFDPTRKTDKSIRTDASWRGKTTVSNNTNQIPTNPLF